MFEDGPTTCERCGGELRRVFHPTGIIFKGGGFYKTDSRPSASDGVAGSSNGTSAGSGDKSAPATPSSATGSGDKGSVPKSSGGGAGKGESGSGSGSGSG